MPNQQMDSGRDASNNAFKKGDRHLMVSSLSAPVKYRTGISPGVYRPTSCSTRREMTGNHMPQGARSIAEACLDALATAAVEGTRAAGDHSVHGAGTGGGVPTPTTVVTKHGSARHEPTTVPARVDSTLLLEPLRLARAARRKAAETAAMVGDAAPSASSHTSAPGSTRSGTVGTGSTLGGPGSATIAGSHSHGRHYNLKHKPEKREENGERRGVEEHGCRLRHQSWPPPPRNSLQRRRPRGAAGGEVVWMRRWGAPLVA